MWNGEAKGAFVPGGKRPGPAQAVWDRTWCLWLLPGPLTARPCFSPYSNVDRAWKKKHFPPPPLLSGFLLFNGYPSRGRGASGGSGLMPTRCWDRRPWSGPVCFPGPRASPSLGRWLTGHPVASEQLEWIMAVAGRGLS